MKIGIDSEAASMQLAHAEPTTIADMRALPKPPHVPNHWPRQDGTEHTVFILKDVRITDYREEADGDQDFHIVVSDGHQTMIVEVPDPSCVETSAWKTRIASARQRVTQHLAPTGSWKTAPNEPVTIVGVGFFDKIHGQRGHAPNGIELHPVLDICWGAGCSLASSW